MPRPKRSQTVCICSFVLPDGGIILCPAYLHKSLDCTLGIERAVNLKHDEINHWTTGATLKVCFDSILKSSYRQSISLFSHFSPCKCRTSGSSPSLILPAGVSWAVRAYPSPLRRASPDKRLQFASNLKHTNRRASNYENKRLLRK